jgi:hypothetical protein
LFYSEISTNIIKFGLGHAYFQNIRHCHFDTEIIKRLEESKQARKKERQGKERN